MLTQRRAPRIASSIAAKNSSPLESTAAWLPGDHLGSEGVERSPELGAVDSVGRVVLVDRPLVGKGGAARQTRERQKEKDEAEARGVPVVQRAGVYRQGSSRERPCPTAADERRPDIASKRCYKLCRRMTIIVIDRPHVCNRKLLNQIGFSTGPRLASSLLSQDWRGSKPHLLLSPPGRTHPDPGLFFAPSSPRAGALFSRLARRRVGLAKGSGKAMLVRSPACGFSPPTSAAPRRPSRSSRSTPAPSRVVREARYASAEHAELEEILSDFLSTERRRPARRRPRRCRSGSGRAGPDHEAPLVHRRNGACPGSSVAMSFASSTTSSPTPSASPTSSRASCARWPGAGPSRAARWR